jgi:hypothetical protein
MLQNTCIIISPSALFIAGMIAFHPALRTLVAYAYSDTSIPHRVRKDRILEALLRSLPCLPLTAVANDIVDYDHIWSSATLSQKEPVVRMYGRWWEPVLAKFEDEAESLFVTRCAALLNTLCRKTESVALPLAAGQGA